MSQRALAAIVFFAAYSAAWTRSSLTLVQSGARRWPLLGGNWGYPWGQGRGNLSKDDKRKKRARRGGPCHRSGGLRGESAAPEFRDCEPQLVEADHRDIE